MTMIFLLKGTVSFPDPGDWDSINNKIECLGSGMRGGPATLMPNIVAQDQTPGQQANPLPPGSGGGGGGYGYKTGSTPTFPVKVQVAARNTTGGSTTPSKSTYWNNVSTTYEVWGGCGDLGSQGGFGAAGSYSPQGFSGGNGSASSGNASWAGDGGGGAAGPHGSGSSGAVGTASVAGAGGAGDNGTTAPSGVAGTQWDASHGCGSGGRGGTSTLTGQPGGAYGAGGGSQAGDTTWPTYGDGTDGLLVITYTPLVIPNNNYAMIMN